MSEIFVLNWAQRYGKHSMYTEAMSEYDCPRYMERLYDYWAEKFDDARVSLTKPKHSFDQLAYVWSRPLVRMISRDGIRFEMERFTAL